MRLVPMDMSVSWAMPSVEDFMIRCGKMNEYIVDTDVSLQSIVYVRDALNKSQQIEFYLLPFDQQLEESSSEADIDAALQGVPQQPKPQSFCTQEADEYLGFDLGMFRTLDLGVH